MKLGGISFYCLHFLLKYVAYVNNQVRFVIPVLHVLQKIFGAPFLLGISVFVFCFDLCKTRKKTGIANQMSRPAVIGMAVHQYISKNYFRLVLTDGLYQF